MAECRHCGLEITGGDDAADGFCCHGCAAAYEIINGLGLDGYYRRRCIDPAQRPLRPDEVDAPVDYSLHTFEDDDGTSSLNLMVEGLHCAACVWLIESVLGRQPGVVSARVNMTTRRLALKWKGDETDAARLVGAVNAIGYRLVPFDPRLMDQESAKREKELLWAMAVAGFAAGNVMLFSVSVWAGHSQGMGQATRDLMHWLSALVVLPAVAYSGRPFFRSALAVLKSGHTNMDVPISLGVLLACGMSLAETMRSGPHAYFDSAISLLFFLLIGRYLDRRARGRARSSAEHLMALSATAVTLIDDDGSQRVVPPSQVRQGMTVFAAAGDRIAVDGLVVSGRSDVDTSLISGETVPTGVEPGARVFAGTLNLSAPLTLTVSAVGEGTLLSEIVRLMEAAERGRARHVAIADRVARLYAPVVHILASLTFLGWWLGVGAPWQDSLLIAIAVLIITCPCALALAVPVVQVVATGRLLKLGTLVKAGTALERLAVIDTVAFDKTGTLTQGKPEPVGLDKIDMEDLRLAASLAGASRHPLARALVAAVPGVMVAEGVEEVAGQGLRLGEIRLGSRAFLGIDADQGGSDALTAGPELWLGRPGCDPLRISFIDRPREDAAQTIARLKAAGLKMLLISGDRPEAVQMVAEAVGIEDWRAGQSPSDKCAILEDLRDRGHKVLMVGDGLNDAPALATAHVSMSPSTAVDVSQTAADVVFQGHRLFPVAETIGVARRSDKLIRQNFALTFIYNTLTIPLAVAGYVTPLIAAIAMSGSSLVVISNSLRLGRGEALWKRS